MRITTPALSIAIAAMVLGVTPPIRAQDGTNVLLVINDASDPSQQIGARYAAARHVPVDNVAHLRTSVMDEIDRPQYEAEIERPLAGWIARHGAQDRILYIVLTKGVPLRVKGTGGLNGTVASVDSELTLLYRKMTGGSVAPTGHIPNPYFLGEPAASAGKPFSHAAQDIYLVTRLDGFTMADVFNVIDRGLAPVRRGTIVLDQRSNLLGDRNGDAWLAAAAKKLTEIGFGDRVALDQTRTVITGRPDVLGYYSWGSNDAAATRRRLDLGFVPGALAAMFVSTDARTFKEPPDSWSLGKWTDARTFFEGSPQSLSGDLIREGATGVAGHVAEPYLDATIRPQILFPAYLSGFNLAESFYQAMPYLSWQTVVIGDPLCAPFRTQRMSSDEVAPADDPDTDLPRFFSARSQALLAGSGVKPAVAKLLLKADSKLTRGDAAGGRQTLEEVVAIDSTLNGANLALAGIYERSAEFSKAAERYRAILATRPDDILALNNLAYLLAVRQNQPAAALPLAERAYKMVSSGGLASARAQIADTYGWTQHLVGKNAEADPLLTEAAAADPRNAAIQLHLAIVKAALGQNDTAAGALSRALELQPDLENDSDAKALRSRLVISGRQ